MNVLRTYRVRAGLTQKVLSLQSGVNIRQIQKYESEEYLIGNMTLTNAVAISKALGIKTEDLLKTEIDKNL